MHVYRKCTNNYYLATCLSFITIRQMWRSINHYYGTVVSPNSALGTCALMTLDAMSILARFMKTTSFQAYVANYVKCSSWLVVSTSANENHIIPGKMQKRHINKKTGHLKKSLNCAGWKLYNFVKFCKMCTVASYKI